MVDADERHVPRQRQRLGRRHADEQGADQAGPDRAGDGVDAAVVDPGLDDRPGDHRVEQLEVGPAGDLRHDAAERGVQLDLRADDARQHVAAAHHQRRRRLVAARLDAEHERVRSDVVVVGSSVSPSTWSSVIGAAAPRGDGRTRPSGCRGTTSRWRPRSPRSSGPGRRRARTRTRGTASWAPVLLARTSSVQAAQPRRDRRAGQLAEQLRGDAVAAVVGVHGDVRHVGLVGDEHQPAVADDGPALRGRRGTCGSRRGPGRARRGTRAALHGFGYDASLDGQDLVTWRWRIGSTDGCAGAGPVEEARSTLTPAPRRRSSAALARVAQLIWASGWRRYTGRMSDGLTPTPRAAPWRGPAARAGRPTGGRRRRSRSGSPRGSRPGSAARRRRRTAPPGCGPAGRRRARRRARPAAPTTCCSPPGTWRYIA